MLAHDVLDEDVADAASAFSEGLSEMGYPPCPGGVMVSIHNGAETKRRGLAGSSPCGATPRRRR